MKRSGLCLILAAALLLPAVSLQAQVLGTIEGTVTDDAGGALPGVSVTVSNDNTGASRVVMTNELGYYSASRLQPGVYTVVAELDGLQPTRGEFLEVLTGQVVVINLSMVAGVEEIITVTSSSPLIETRRAASASYVGQQEIESLPISDRDFKEYAFLAPTVQNDTVRGFVTMSGQRGINTGMNIDGTDSKSAFFGYGRGGEATENDGLVVAQDSVQEFQIVTSGFNPEAGNSGGGFINVVTKSGTNQLKGTAFYFFRDDGMADDLPASPLDKSRDNGDATPVDTFDRKTYGGSVGGPIVKDRTHFFFSFDKVDRSVPFKDDFNTKGGYDAILAMEAQIPGISQLVDGYTPNNDGIAAPDGELGRTASGTFTRAVDNTVYFGKLNHQFNDSHSGSLRINYTDYERLSDFKDEESKKTEVTNSIVAEVVSIFGSNKINEFRLQHATDDLDRLSLRVGEQVEALVRFRDRGAGRDQVGKFDFLPIIAEEEKFQLQNSFSYLFGEHDLKFGIEYQKDDLAQVFKGSADGRYDFQSIDDFLANDASNARIYYGNVSFPNYDEYQVTTAFYAQDTWRASDNLTLSYGFRYGKTDNPDGLTHIFPEGESIPDDTHWAPRLGFTYAPGDQGNHVIRGGAGVFYARTPTLLFASQVQENGLFPNYGRVNVQGDDAAFVPLGQQINNTNPPDGTIPSTAFVRPGYNDPKTERFNLGYERQFAESWAGGVDLVFADGSDLQSNVETNRTQSYDEFGRPMYSSVRPDATFNQIFVRESIGTSEYTALTFSVRRRFTGKYQFQAHYTFAEDKDTDSNERSATSVTVSDPTNPKYDWGHSERDVKNRFVASGMYELPWGMRVSGIFEYRSGTPWNQFDGDVEFGYCGFGNLGFACTDPRPIVDGAIAPRNNKRSESVQRLDLRLSKLIEFGDRYQVQLFAEAFNVLNENSFAVVGDQRDPATSEYALADRLVTTPRQYQFGFRFRF